MQHADTGHACGLVQVGLSERINAAGGQVPKKVIEAPFVQIPLGVTEDRLVGTVDIEASMKVCQPYSHHSCFLTLTDAAAAHVTIIYAMRIESYQVLASNIACEAERAHCV